jgi:hypothetical protein
LTTVYIQLYANSSTKKNVVMICLIYMKRLLDQIILYASVDSELHDYSNLLYAHTTSSLYMLLMLCLFHTRIPIIELELQQPFFF